MAGTVVQHNLILYTLLHDFTSCMHFVFMNNLYYNDVYLAKTSVIRPFQVVVLFLVRVLPRVTGGRAGFIIISLLRYHPIKRCHVADSSRSVV